MNCEKIWEQIIEASKKAYADAEANLPEFEIVETDIFGNRISDRSYKMQGLCGFAWVKIKPARGKMVSWLKKNNIGKTDSYAGGYMLWVGGDIPAGSTQAIQTKEAIASAAVKILQENGIRAWKESRLD